MKQTNQHLTANRILIGNAVTRLKELPDASIDTVVTSPPYFLLRDYGHDGQIGSEQHIDQWVNQLLDVTSEVARVLKPAGSMWLNLGDTYSRHNKYGGPPKSMLLGPEKLLLKLVEQGWLVRNKIVWAKPNPMPSSVGDRLSCTWEPIYLLTRSKRYFFDLDAIRIPAKTQSKKSGATSDSAKMKKYSTSGTGRGAWAGALAGNNNGLERMKATGVSSHPLGKNPGDVWPIATARFSGAHFATFPQSLVTRPLLATCPERTCATCGMAWRRAKTVQSIGRVACRGVLRKSCACKKRSHKPGIVLDPFIGSGTVALEAERLQRRWLGIELNEDYAKLAEKRICERVGKNPHVSKERKQGGGNGQ